MAVYASVPPQRRLAAAVPGAPTSVEGIGRKRRAEMARLAGNVDPVVLFPGPQAPEANQYALRRAEELQRMMEAQLLARMTKAAEAYNPAPREVAHYSQEDLRQTRPRESTLKTDCTRPNPRQDRHAPLPKNYWDLCSRSLTKISRTIEKAEAMSNLNLALRAWNGFLKHRSHRHICRLKGAAIINQHETALTVRALSAWAQQPWIQARERDRLKYADELASKHAQAVEQEKRRRTEQARRVVARITQQHVARAFEQLRYQALACRRRRAMCGRVMARMRHAALGKAFDALTRRAAAMRGRKEALQRVLTKWQQPDKARAMQRWGAYVQEAKAAAREQVHEEAMAGLRQEWNEANARGEAAVQREIERRQAVCRQVVGRMLRAGLASAFYGMVQGVGVVRERRARRRGVLARLQRRGLAMAFENLRCEVQQRRSRRAAVGRAQGRWCMSALLTAMEAWHAYMAWAEAGRRDAARQAMMERARQVERARRREHAGRMVLRLIKRDLTHAFSTLQSQVRVRKGYRQVVGRVVRRMMMRKHALVWGRWRQYCERERTIRTRMARGERRRTQSAAGRAWSTWRQKVYRGRIARTAMAKMTRLAQRRAWRRWGSGAGAEARRRQMLCRVRRGWERRRVQGALGGWCERHARRVMIDHICVKSLLRVGRQRLCEAWECLYVHSLVAKSAPKTRFEPVTEFSQRCSYTPSLQHWTKAWRQSAKQQQRAHELSMAALARWSIARLRPLVWRWRRVAQVHLSVLEKRLSRAARRLGLSQLAKRFVFWLSEAVKARRRGGIKRQVLQMVRRACSWRQRCFFVSWVLYCLARQEVAKDNDEHALQKQEQRDRLAASAFSAWVVTHLRVSRRRNCEATRLMECWRQWTRHTLLAVRVANLQLARENQAPLIMCSISGAVESMVLVAFLKWRALISTALCKDLAARVTVLIQTIANLSHDHIAPSCASHPTRQHHAYV